MQAAFVFIFFGKLPSRIAAVHFVARDAGDALPGFARHESISSASFLDTRRRSGEASRRLQNREAKLKEPTLSFALHWPVELKQILSPAS